MDENKTLVFLTKGEITIDTSTSLSIHLKPDDKRIKSINSGIEKGNLQFVVVNPQIVNVNSSFFRENWYLIRSLRHTASWNHDKFKHFSFYYTLNQKIHNWQQDGVRMLTCEERDKFKKTLCI